jgi:hypothetical protein
MDRDTLRFVMFRILHYLVYQPIEILLFSQIGPLRDYVWRILILDGARSSAVLLIHLMPSIHLFLLRSIQTEELAGEVENDSCV